MSNHAKTVVITHLELGESLDSLSSSWQYSQDVESDLSYVSPVIIEFLLHSRTVLLRGRH